MRLCARTIDVGTGGCGQELGVKNVESTLGIASTEKASTDIAKKHCCIEMYCLLEVRLGCAAASQAFSEFDNANVRCQQRPDWRELRPEGPA
jgi:hypothetical protein